jgi:hypothetical protein
MATAVMTAYRNRDLPFSLKKQQYIGGIRDLWECSLVSLLVPTGQLLYNNFQVLPF